MLTGNLFDGLLLTTLAICVIVWPTQWISDKQNRWLRIVAVGLVALQLAVDGPRGQLLPAYLVAVIFGVRLIPRQRDPDDSSRSRESREGILKKLARWTMVVATAGLLFVSIVLSVIFPRIQFLKPTGEFAVGLHTLYLTDSSRLEAATEDPADHRELSLRITYPAAADPAIKATQESITSYLVMGPIVALRTASANSKFATALPQSWGRIPTNAWIDTPIATARQSFPVVIFSHGMTSLPEQYIAVTQELASHGFVVIAINHPGLSGNYETPHGPSIGFREYARRINAIAETKDQQRSIRSLATRLSDPELPLEVRRQLVKEEEATRPELMKLLAEMHRLASDDQRFVFDELDRLQSGDPILHGRLDLEHTGVFGMSMGGSAGHITCVVDKRCRAGINMDGFHPLLAELPPLEVPFMHMAQDGNFRPLLVHERSRAHSYIARVKGAAHNSYSDFPLVASGLGLLKPFGINVSGTIDPNRMSMLTNDYVVAFFNKSLLGKNEPLLDGPSERYPEVHFTMK